MQDTYNRDLRENFMQALSQIVGNPGNQSKLLKSDFTHVSMALDRDEQQGIFQIGFLLFKANFTVEKVF